MDSPSSKRNTIVNGRMMKQLQLTASKMVTFPTNSTVVKETHEDNFAPYISMIVLSIITIISNCIVFFVIVHHRNLRRRTSNKFVLNLTLSNTCVASAMLSFAACVIGLNTNEHTFGNHNEPAPEISLMFGVLILLSVMNMIVLSGDRLYAVKWTFSYFQSTTAKKINMVIVLPWVISVIYFVILICLLNVGSHAHRDTVKHVIYFSFDVIAFLGFVTLAGSNTIIYKAARTQLVHIRRNSVPETSLTKRSEKRFDFRERRLALINVGLVVKFVIFWLPTLATMNYHLVWEKSTSEVVEYLSFHLVLLNGLCDPTVYVALSRDIRKAIMVSFCREERPSALSGPHTRTLKSGTEDL